MEDCNFIAPSHGTFTVSIDQKEEFDKLSKESEKVVRETINTVRTAINITAEDTKNEGRYV